MCFPSHNSVMETSQPGAEAPPALARASEPSRTLGSQGRVFPLLLFSLCSSSSATGATHYYFPENSSRHRRSARRERRLGGSSIVWCQRADELGISSSLTTPSSDPPSPPPRGGSIGPAHTKSRGDAHVRCLAGVDFRVRGSSREPGISVAG